MASPRGRPAAALRRPAAARRRLPALLPAPFLLLLLLLPLLLLLAPAPRAAAQSSAGVADTLNEIFQAGSLNGMDVSGSVAMRTEGDDLRLDVVTYVENDGVGLETEFSLRDGKCDFREVELSVQANVYVPSALRDLANSIPGLGNLLPEKIKVAAASQTYSFLPADGAAAGGTVTVRLRDSVGAASRTVLDWLGADATFTVEDPTFMATGLSFKLFFAGSVLNPDTSDLCDNSLFRTALAAAAGLSDTLCTDAGGVEIPRTNLGLQLRGWLDAAGESTDWIDADTGLITVGAAGAVCNLEPVDFSVTGTPLAGAPDLACLAAANPADACQGPARDALLAGINSQLPDGYQIDASQLDGLTVSVDPATGDLTIAGKMYAGAAKDPAALVDALRRYVAGGGDLDLGGGTKVSADGDDVDDGDATAQCMRDPARVAAKMCSPGDAPPTGYIPGGTASGAAGADGSKDAGDMAADDTAKDGDSTMLVVGAVLITLAVVGGVVGIVMAVKVMNKRRNTVSSHRFATLEGGDGQRLRTPADAFESVGVAPQPPQQQPVWGDVVQVSSADNRIPRADKAF